MHLLESFMDISEQKKIEEAIRENEEKTSMYFNGTDDGLLILSPEKGFQHANVAAVGMFGAETLPDLLRCGPVEISPEFQPDGRNSAEAAKEHIAAAIKSGTTYRFEWMHKRFDGSLLPVEVTLKPIVLAGEPQLLVSIRDITERRQSEVELKKRMDELERFSRLTINREEKMIQLKEEINALLAQAGKEQKYKIVGEKT
jgi:PAS domain S-box-containing protein